MWLFELLRVKQWYKNVIVFVALFFSGLFMYGSAWQKVFLAFIALCLMSSVNYIINDYADREKDRLDSVKCRRPISSGKVSPVLALFVAIVLFSISLALGYYLHPLFLILLLGLFTLTQLYTFWFKDKVFLDVIMIALNFIIRAVSGAVVLGVYITEWFVIGIFFLAMFLVFVKRYGEAKAKLHKNRKTLEFYSPELMEQFVIVFLVLLIMLYSLYIILEHQGYWFLATIPVFTLILLRYFMIVKNSSDLARHAEKLFFRKDLLLAGFFWLILFIFALCKGKYGFF